MIVPWTGNRGEWAELAVKCAFLVYGYFFNAITNEPRYFDYMIIRGQRYDPKKYPPEVDAPLLLERGIERIENGMGPSFDNPFLEHLAHTLNIKMIKASSKEKEDMILVKGSNKVAYHIENIKANRPSWVNASPATRISYLVVREDGKPIAPGDVAWALAQYGEGSDGGAKKRVKRMVDEGYALGPCIVRHDGFRRAISDIGVDELGCLCKDFLQNYGKGQFNDILSIHKQHTDDNMFNHTKEHLIRYTRKCILNMPPTGYAQPNRKIPNEGMVFLNADNIVLVDATNMEFWDAYIYEGASFDIPSTSKHDFGYVYTINGKLYFDYALGIKGTFKGMLK